MSPKGVAFRFTGEISPVSGPWQAVYFDVRKRGADLETLSTLPVACWAVCVKNKQHVVGGMVAGPSGLEFAELSEDFRGYIPEEGKEAEDAFVKLWEREQGFSDPEGDEEEEDENEDENEEDEDRGEDE